MGAGRSWPIVAAAAIAIVTTALAAGLLSLAWTSNYPTVVTLTLASVGPLTLAACLIAGGVASYRYPIHIGHKTKVSMASVPFYLLAVLLSPPLAATAAGLGVLVAEFSVRNCRGLPTSAIVTAAARWIPIILLGALIAHLPGSDILHSAALVTAGVVLGAGDILNFALVIGPLTGHRPRHLILMALSSWLYLRALESRLPTTRVMRGASTVVQSAGRSVWKWIERPLVSR